jgi:hypothetical protein
MIFLVLAVLILSLCSHTDETPEDVKL